MHALLKIDSSVRNGQLVYAYRQTCKLYSDLKKGDHDVGQGDIEALLSSVKRTILMLKPVIAAYAQNQTSIEIIRRSGQCRKTQPSAQ